MKLFISYSRDDKAWVYELWRVLRDEGQHDAWIDRRLVVAQDWWHGILESIENCECFIYVMTPKSTESIYCRAEVEYAVVLNKPILPLMLKPCDLPAILSQKRIQYQLITDDMSMDKVLFKASQGLTEVLLALRDDKYPPTPAVRPDTPAPEKHPEQASEVFLLAEEATAENNLSLAEKLFQQVIDADPQGYGEAAKDRLAEIRVEYERNRDYLNLVQMANNPALAKGAKAARRVFVKKYGTAYDPSGVLHALSQEDAPLLAQPPEQRAHPIKPASVTRMTDPTGVVMVFIPAGTYLMGSTPEQVEEACAEAQMERKDVRRDWFADQIPLHEVVIRRPFWLDLTPLTNAIYARFVQEGGYHTREFWTEAGWAWLQRENKTGPRDYDGFMAPDQPRVGVSWFEAYACCRWRGGRLPTEAEWEYAARGPENRVFPWGNTFVGANAVYGKTGGGRTAPVGEGIRTSGASWAGVLDMSGNVWEWVNSLYRPYPYTASDGRESIREGSSPRVLRGGSWWSDLTTNLRSAYRGRGEVNSENNDGGFRCAHPVE